MIVGFLSAWGLVWTAEGAPLASRLSRPVPTRPTRRARPAPPAYPPARPARPARPERRGPAGHGYSPSNCSCSWMIMKFERGKRLALRFPLTIIVYSWGISLRIEIGTICLRSLLGTHVSPSRIHNMCYVLPVCSPGISFELLHIVARAGGSLYCSCTCPLDAAGRRLMCVVWLQRGSLKLLYIVRPMIRRKIEGFVFWNTSLTRPRRWPSADLGPVE